MYGQKVNNLKHTKKVYATYRVGPWIASNVDQEDHNLLIWLGDLLATLFHNTAVCVLMDNSGMLLMESAGQC